MIGLSKERLIKIAIFVFSFLVIAVLIWGLTSSRDKLLKVVAHNVGFWIVLAMAFVFGLVRKLTSPEKFKWVELPIQLFVSLAVIVGLYAFFFATSTHLMDTEIWNGQATRAEYYEKWTEKRITTRRVPCGRDSQGNTRYRSESTTSYVHHPPHWKILTTVGDLNTSQGVYEHYVSRFNNPQKKKLFHGGQSSWGDGNMYYVDVPRGALPASQEHIFVNYLRASEAVKKVSRHLSNYQKFLQPYPRVREGKFGRIEVNRVINAGATVPLDWRTTLDRYLDSALVTLGSVKQVNVLVYIMGTTDEEATQALEDYWVKGKKNDVIVVLGMPYFPRTNFIHIMAWSKNEDFGEELRRRLMYLPDFNLAQNVAGTIIDQIKKPAGLGGFERRPMADLEYLIADIKLPFWCQILIVLVGGASCWGVSYFLVSNDI